MKCKQLRLLVIVLLIMPVTVQAVSITRAVIALNIFRGFLVGSGVGLSFMTGMNLPQVASNMNFDDCSPSTPENCYRKQYWEGGNPKGFAAMWGTIAPSLDAPIWVADSLYKVGYSVLSMGSNDRLKVPTWQKGVYLSLNLALISGSLYGAYFYGEGDQQGAETVGESVAKIAAFNEWCEDNIKDCTTQAADVYHGNTNTTWREHEDEAHLGYWYGVMNRVGGASVGYTLGGVIVSSMLFPVAHFLGAEAGTVNNFVHKIWPSLLGSAPELPQLEAMPQILLPSLHAVMGAGVSKLETTPQVAWHYSKLGLGYLRGLTAWLTWFVIPNPFEGFASPVFNPVNYNRAALASLNNADIEFNEHGILYHRDDPHKDEYVSLDKAEMAVAYLVNQGYVTEDDIERMRQAQHKVGVGIYGRQYAMLTVAFFSHLWSLPLNIRDFVTAFSESKRIFVGDILWTAGTIAAIWPYNVNLNGFIGTQHANGTQSIEALVAYTHGENRTEAELMSAQEGLVQGNTVVINGAWLGGVHPRLTNLLNTFSPPVPPEVLGDEGQIELGAMPQPTNPLLEATSPPSAPSFIEADALLKLDPMLNTGGASTEFSQ